MKQTFTVEERLPGYNELMAGNNWQARYRAKQKGISAVMYAFLKYKTKPVNNPINVNITCVEPNNRRDYDNIIGGALKVILDALQQAKILPNDNRKWVRLITQSVETDKNNPHVTVVLEEVENNG